MLPIVLEHSQVDQLIAHAQRPTGLTLSIDLAQQSITLADGSVLRFAVDADRKHRLLNGLDDIAITLEKGERIKEYEATRKRLEPWLFG